MDSAAALEILEAAYAVDHADDDWLLGIVAAARPTCDLGLGVCAYFTQIGGPGEVWNHGHVGELWRDVKTLYESVLGQIGPEAMRQLHLLGPFGSTVRLADASFDPSRVGASLGSSSAIGIMGLDVEGRGVSLASWSPPGQLIPPRPGEEAFWGRVAPHLAAAARLRRRLSTHAQGPEAIFEPGGKLVHAEGDAKLDISRDALREAARRVDRVRARRRRVDSDETLEVWRCLVERRWSIVDQFESDGRRYVVAHPNAPRPRADLSELTARELAVAQAAALGHANKVIAYELGVTESTVATLLSRAARKLGVRSRVELISRVRAAPVSER